MRRGSTYKAKATWSTGDSTKTHTFTPLDTHSAVPDTWQVRIMNDCAGSIDVKIESVDEDGGLCIVHNDLNPRTMSGDTNEEWTIETKNPSLKVTVTENAGTLGTGGDLVVKVKAWGTTEWVDVGDAYSNTAIA